MCAIVNTAAEALQQANKVCSWVRLSYPDVQDPLY